MNKLVRQIHRQNVAKGFYSKKNKNIGEILCLIHSEISEVLDADRQGVWAGKKISKVYKKL